MSEIQKHDAASIENITSPKEAVHVKEMADAAAKFYSAQDDWLTAQQAKEIALRSARQAGALLAEIPRKPGERTDLTSDHYGRRLKEVIEDAGISPSTAKRWQKLSEVPDDRLELYFGDAHYKNWEYSIASLLRWFRQVSGVRTAESAPPIEFEAQISFWERNRGFDKDQIRYTIIDYSRGAVIPNGKYKVRLTPLEET